MHLARSDASENMSVVELPRSSVQSTLEILSTLMQEFGVFAAVAEVEACGVILTRSFRLLANQLGEVICSRDPWSGETGAATAASKQDASLRLGQQSTSGPSHPPGFDQGRVRTTPVWHIAWRVQLPRQRHPWSLWAAISFSGTGKSSDGVFCPCWSCPVWPWSRERSIECQRSWKPCARGFACQRWQDKSC